MDAADEHFSLLADMVGRLSGTLDEEESSTGCNELNIDSRKYCKRCQRPENVCLCDYLPKSNLELKNDIKIWIFQHPAEEKRPLHTTRILEKSFDEKNFEIIKSRRFCTERYPELKHVYESPNSYVLYPSESALSLEDFKILVNEHRTSSSSDDNNNQRKFNIIIIDGTWPQASGIYMTNSELRALKQIKIQWDKVSEYTVRTQPRESFLSTIECVAIILSIIEDNQNIYDALLKPLRALCELQIKHGAQHHHSKEYLIVNGMYKKPLSKRMCHKLTQDTKLLSKNEKVSNESALK